MHEMIYCQFDEESLFGFMLFFGLAVFGFSSAIIAYRKNTKIKNNTTGD
ncbi:MAG: hypothetical protein ABJ256_21285 [Nisaea sp.]